MGDQGGAGGNVSKKCPKVLFLTFLCTSKDARLPEQLQRAMAAEAEAAREARAKVRCRNSQDFL